jgi:S-adenosylmethionine synthetase
MGRVMKNILVDQLRQVPLEQQRVEICERKGLGHPDTICDSIMNEVSVSLSNEYMKRFGTVMHHNIDKSLLVAGEVEHRFGGGSVKKPMLLVFGDRATFEVGDEKIPVNEIAITTAKDWFRRNLRFVEPDENVQYQVELKRGSAELTDIFARGGEFLGANDTSAAVGFAPMTQTEAAVLETERFMNSKQFKKEFPETGEDIKVMGMRRDRDLDLTIALAFVDRFIESENDYFRRKQEVQDRVVEFAKSKVNMDSVNVYINTLDVPGRGMGGIYLTVLGTSADDADCGQVGRGNRVNGIIPLNRPTSSEAAAGKNPTSHVGKIYNLLTYRMATRIYEDVGGLQEVYVWLLSQIGVPVNQPKIAAAQLVLQPGVELKSVQRDVREVMESELDDGHLKRFINSLIKGRTPIA